MHLQSFIKCNVEVIKTLSIHNTQSFMSTPKNILLWHVYMMYNNMCIIYMENVSFFLIKKCKCLY